MSIAVVLCTYNGERYIEQQIEAIRSQTRLPDVLVVQDDGSSDSTVAIVQACTSRLPFPLQLHRNDRHLGFAQNFASAISNCKADVIVLSDQDDWWHAGRLAMIDAAFAALPDISAIFSDAEVVDQNLRSLGYGVLHAARVSSVEMGLVRRGNLLPVLLRRNIVAGMTLALKARRKDRILPIPRAAYHDEWIALISAAFGELHFIGERLVQYRQHAANQLGGRRLRIPERIKGILKHDADDSRRRLLVIQDLYDRLIAMRGADPTMVNEVKGKLEHLKTRTALPAQRLSRIQPVLNELTAGRYARYSFGWRTALRDIVSAAS
jgi:glycosyltransferase involved in cell wall biosynthesis